jgi:aerotaxis receptor
MENVLSLEKSPSEIHLSDNDVIISRTDKKGRITYASADFARISEFSIDEMLGKPHNIIRHPDMPKQAFQSMWRTIQSGLPWTGAVKNKTKNGNYYWVDATITPIIRNNEIVGFVSVRKKLTELEKKKFDSLYSQMKNKFFSNKSDSKSKLEKIPIITIKDILFILSLFSVSGLTIWLNHLLSFPWMYSTFGLGILYPLLIIVHLILKNKEFHYLTQISIKVASGNLLSSKETLKDPKSSQSKFLYLSIKSIGINLWGITTQLSKITDSFSKISDDMTEIADNFAQSSQNVAAGTEEAAASMEEINSALDSIHNITIDNQEMIDACLTSISILNSNLTDTDTSLGHMENVFEQSMKQVAVSQVKIQDSYKSMLEIQNVSKRILTILSMIHEISDRTNLLSLNASIEAARAGEAGKGFSVVAKEISKLNEKILESAKSIQLLVGDTITVVTDGLEKSTQATESIREVESSLGKVDISTHSLVESLHKNLEEARSMKERILNMQQKALEIQSSIAESNNASQGLADSITQISSKAQSIVHEAEILANKSRIVKKEPQMILDLVDHYRNN